MARNLPVLTIPGGKTIISFTQKYFYNDILNDENNQESIFNSIQFRNVLVKNASYIGIEGILSVFDYSNDNNYDADEFINAIDINWNNPYLETLNGQYMPMGINTTGNLLNYIKESYSICGINLDEYVKFADAKKLFKERTDRINELNIIINKWLGRKFAFIDNDNTSTEIGRIISLNSNTQLLLINTLKFVSTQNNTQYCKFSIMLNIDFEDNELGDITLYQQIDLTNSQSINIEYNNETLFTIEKNASYFSINNVKDNYTSNCKFNLTIEQTNKIDNDDNAKLNYIINFNKTINIDNPKLAIYDIRYNGTSIYDTNNSGLITGFNMAFPNGVLGNIEADQTNISVDVLYYYWINSDDYEHIGFLFKGTGNTYYVYIKEDNQTLKNNIETMLRNSSSDNNNFSYFDSEDINFEFIVSVNGIPNLNNINDTMFWKSSVNVKEFPKNSTQDQQIQTIDIKINRKNLDNKQDNILLGYCNIDQNGNNVGYGKLTLKKISIPPHSLSWLNGNENSEGRYELGVDIVTNISDNNFNIFNNTSGKNFAQLKINQNAPVPQLWNSYIALRRQLPISGYPKNCLTYEPFIYYKINNKYYTFVEIDTTTVTGQSHIQEYIFVEIKDLNKFKKIISYESELNDITDNFNITPHDNRDFLLNIRNPRTNFVNWKYDKNNKSEDGNFTNARYLRRCVNNRKLKSAVPDRNGKISLDNEGILCTNGSHIGGLAVNGFTNVINIDSETLNVEVHINYYVAHEYKQGNVYFYDLDEGYYKELIKQYTVNIDPDLGINRIGLAIPGCYMFNDYESIFKDMINNVELYRDGINRKSKIQKNINKYFEYYNNMSLCESNLLTFMSQWSNNYSYCRQIPVKKQ